MIPTPHTITVHTRTTPGHAHWRDSTFATGVNVAVHAITVNGDAPTTSKRELVRTTATVYAPGGTLIAPGDKVEWHNTTWRVANPPADYTHGPWDSPGGIVFTMEKVTG